MAVFYLKRESLTWKAGTYMDTKAYIKIFLNIEFCVLATRLVQHEMLTASEIMFYSVGYIPLHYTQMNVHAWECLCIHLYIQKPQLKPLNPE